MRLTAATVLAGAASSAVAAAASYSSSGKPHMMFSDTDTVAAPSFSLDSPRLLPFATVTQFYTVTAISTKPAESLTPDSTSSSKIPLITETDLSQPPQQPSDGAYKTIGCGCSYKFPNGFIECPFSGSEAPPGYCSSEVVTTTPHKGHGNAAHSTASADGDGTTASRKTNPTAALSSVISAASSWPTGVHPGMQPPNMPPANDTCVTSLDGTFNLGQMGISSANDKIDKPVIHTALAEMSLIDGTLIDSFNRIGSIVANGQFQFDGPPQAGTLYTAGWTACGPEGDRKLAFAGETTLYACNSGSFSNLYYKETGSECSAVELVIVMSEQAPQDPADDGEKPLGNSNAPDERSEESALDFATLLESDAPPGCSTNAGLAHFDIQVVGLGESNPDSAAGSDLNNGDDLTRTPMLLLSRYSMQPLGVMKDLDGRSATFDEHHKLRFEYDVSNELPWSACENNLLAFGDTRGFYECGTDVFRAIYDSDVGENCVQVKLVYRDVSPWAQLPQLPYVPPAPTVSIPPVPLAREAKDEHHNLVHANSDSPVPSVSAVATPALVDRAPEPGFSGGFANDQPAELNYLLTTKTITLPAATGVDPSDDNSPDTTWTLPATTIVITEAPAPTTAVAARRDAKRSAIESASYWQSVLSSAKSELSVVQQQTATQQISSTITSAPSIPETLEARQELNDIFWTIEQLISTILSAKSASEYWGYVAASISMDLHESTVTFTNEACGTVEGYSSCSTETLFFDTQVPPSPPPQARAEAMTPPPAPMQTITARQELNDVFYTIEQLISTILSAKSASEYWDWVIASLSMQLHESTVTFANEACATVDGVASCSTETLFFATQNPPQAPQVKARAAATADGPIVWDTAGTTGPTKVIAPTTTTSSVPAMKPAEKHDTISVITKTITTLETIVKPSTTFTSTFTTIDTCTEYIGGKCIQKRDWPSLITTAVTRSNEHTTITTTMECRAWQGSCIDVHSLPPRANEDDTTIVTKSVPVATVTEVVTAPAAIASSDTTCSNSTTATVCSASSCSYVNSTVPSFTYHWGNSLTLSSVTALPVTANNSTSKTIGTAGTVSTTTTVNGTFSQTAPASQSTTAEVGGTSDADGGKQVALATVGMAVFAVLAFFL